MRQLKLTGGLFVCFYLCVNEVNEGCTGVITKMVTALSGKGQRSLTRNP